MPTRRQRTERFEPVTMGHVRGHGCRNLLVYCVSGHCHHTATKRGLAARRRAGALAVDLKQLMRSHTGEISIITAPDPIDPYVRNKLGDFA